ncbi:hypothetical protein HanOQP8_Chr02g0053371 [Helianthus annuus]|nr:hypothetical protein HanOQP8_Chr02g0053371 [Helianthus annuus]
MRNIIQTLIYRKYQRRIHHVCIILHTPRYLNHLPKQTTNVNMFMFNQMSKCLCEKPCLTSSVNYVMSVKTSKCLCQCQSCRV